MAEISSTLPAPSTHEARRPAAATLVSAETTHRRQTPPRLAAEIIIDGYTTYLVDSMSPHAPHRADRNTLLRSQPSAPRPALRTRSCKMKNAVFTPYLIDSSAHPNRNLDTS